MVVDDQALCRDAMADILRQRGYRVLCAPNGQEALDLLQEECPALLLLDVKMPGLDGIAVLRGLRERPRTSRLPVVLLTDARERQIIVEAARLGVRDYLLKSNFSVTELLRRVESHISAPHPVRPDEASESQPPGAKDADGPTPSGAPEGEPAPPDAPQASVPAPPVAAERTSAAPTSRVDSTLEIPRMLTRDQTLERLGRHTQERTLAGAVAEVIALASSPRASQHDLVLALKRDPILSARVLQVANSAAFTSATAHIANLDDAVRNIGFGPIRNVATAVGLIQAMPPDAADGFNSLRCWQHCFAVAAIMDAIVDTDEEADPQLAYLTGLFHDVGEILLRQYFPEEFVRIGELSMATGRGHREVEALILGIPHHELVATMLSILKLPEAITGPIREFLQLDGRDTPVKLSRMARCLTLANQYAHGLQLASTPSATVAPVTKVDCRRALGNADVAPLDNVRTRCDVLSTTFLLARMTPSEEASLSRPWFPQRQTQIWYARHSALAEFDPLCAALDLLGHVTVHDHPPRDAEEFGDKDCVVMAVPRIGLDPFSLIRVEAFLRSVGRARPPILCHVQRDVDRTKQDGSMMKIVSGGMPLHELAGFVTAAFLEGAPDRAPAACASGET